MNGSLSRALERRCCRTAVMVHLESVSKVSRLKSSGACGDGVRNEDLFDRRFLIRPEISARRGILQASCGRKNGKILALPVI